MANAGFSVGTFTGGGTFLVESLSGTLTPVGVVAWGGSGTATRVVPTAAGALPVTLYAGTLNAGTVTVSNTGTVVGTVAVSNTGTVTGTVAISTIAAGTVVATAAGTQTVAGTVSVSGGTIGLSGGTISTIAAGTVAISTIAAGTVAISTIAAGTVVATAAGTQTVAGTVAVSTIAAGTVVADQRFGGGKTLQYGTVNLTSGSVSLVNPGTGTTAYIVGMTLTAGTAGIIQFLQGVGAAALSGPIHLDQYGGFVDRGRISEPVMKSAAGSQVYLSITSGIGTIGGYYSYYVEA